jgi:hypothetical protein
MSRKRLRSRQQDSTSEFAESGRRGVWKWPVEIGLKQSSQGEIKGNWRLS